MGDADADDEVDLLVTDLYTHVYFNWNVHLNEILKALRVEDCYDPITTSHLKTVPRILLWVVSHISGPKNGWFSSIDNAEIHLVYILLHKVKLVGLTILYLVCCLSKNATRALLFDIPP